MALKIVHLAGGGPDKIIRDRKPTPKEILHRKAVESMAATKIADRERAKKMFAPQRERINKLIEERDELRRQLAKN